MNQGFLKFRAIQYFISHKRNISIILPKMPPVGQKHQSQRIKVC